MRALVIVLVIALASAVPASALFDPPNPVPDVVDGFAVTLLAPLVVPSAIIFGPGGEDGPDLYATLASGQVVRVELAWTEGVPVAVGTSVFATGFSLPLGLVFGPDGALYVADSHPGEESGRTDGRITRILGDERTVVVDGIPNGRHNTNHLRFGPDGRMYVANGNPNDAGPNGGPADVFPYSGAILSVDVDEVTASPAVLRWRDGAGNLIPVDEIATHPLNADFAAKVHVLAYGFRNVYGIAFSPSGVAYTAMNGADFPPSQDSLYKIEPGTDYGFPFCYAVGASASQEVRMEPNPEYYPDHDCSPYPVPTTLLGWHVCATGLDFPTEGRWAFPASYRNAVYIGECGPFWSQPAEEGLTTDDVGHKVVRVPLDADGEALEVSDFVTGLALPTDVLFGPHGAMYVADAGGVLRVAPVLPSS